MPLMIQLIILQSDNTIQVYWIIQVYDCWILCFYQNAKSWTYFRWEKVQVSYKMCTVRDSCVYYVIEDDNMCIRNKMVFVYMQMMMLILLSSCIYQHFLNALFMQVKYMYNMSHYQTWSMSALGLKICMSDLSISIHTQYAVLDMQEWSTEYACLTYSVLVHQSCLLIGPLILLKCILATNETDYSHACIFQDLTMVNDMLDVWLHGYYHAHDKTHI